MASDVASPEPQEQQEPKRNRALLIGRRVLDDELRSVLKGYGYMVEHSRTREEGIRNFRAKRQALVIIDIEAVNGFPERLFRFFRMVRSNAIVLVASGPNQAEASRFLLWGAHDVLQLPLKRDALNFTLSRTSAYHRALVRATFYRNAAWFAAAMLPLWLALLFVSLR
jgi:ActR/RegA family two-component response regulator